MAVHGLPVPADGWSPAALHARLRALRGLADAELAGDWSRLDDAREFTRTARRRAAAEQGPRIERMLQRSVGRFVVSDAAARAYIERRLWVAGDLEAPLLAALTADADAGAPWRPEAYASAEATPERAERLDDGGELPGWRMTLPDLVRRRAGGNRGLAFVALDATGGPPRSASPNDLEAVARAWAAMSFVPAQAALLVTDPPPLDDRALLVAATRTLVLTAYDGEGLLLLTRPEPPAAPAAAAGPGPSPSPPT